jgi:diketogulonate reductase-like aldo/keto reductase
VAYGTGTSWYVGAKGNNQPPNLQVIETFKIALQVGYRHIDCAEVYGTEQEVGVALQQFLSENPNVTRDQFFITTKVWQNLNDIPGAIKGSLSRLQIPYIDLYLIHAPFFSKIQDCKATLSEVWAQFESLVDQGLTRYIGVSNFRIKDFEEILHHARIKPICNQIEYNPYLQQPELIQYCKNQGIFVSAYSPLAPLNSKPDGPIPPVVEKIAIKYLRSPAQILLQWVLQKGVLVITTSRNEVRLREYLELEMNERAFRMSDEDVKEIDEVGKTVELRKYWIPEFAKI